MGTMLVVAALVVTAGALLMADLLGHLEGPRSVVLRVWHRLRPPAPEPTGPPIEALVADLRRLGALLEATRATTEPAKMERLRAAALAYDYVLLSACRTLELPEPERLPLRSLERLQTEADLARHGLRW